jgi:hypothetical protein
MSRFNSSQFEFVQLDDRDRFKAELRPIRINQQADPELPSKLTFMDHFNRVIYADTFQEIMDITVEFNYCFQGGDLAFVAPSDPQNAKMFVWLVEENRWQEIFIGDATTTPYLNDVMPMIANVRDALDLLIMGKPQIKYFNNNVNVVERGSVIHNVKLFWDVNRIAVSQTMNLGIGEINPVTRSLIITSANIYEDTTFSLFVEDVAGKDSLDTTIYFRDKIFYGVSANDTIAEEELLTFKSLLQKDIYFNTEFNCSDEYIYYAFPKSMTVPTFMPFELINNDWVKSEMTIVNKHGQVVDYDIYRSEYTQNASNITISII